MQKWTRGGIVNKIGINALDLVLNSSQAVSINVLCHACEICTWLNFNLALSWDFDHELTGRLMEAVKGNETSNNIKANLIERGHLDVIHIKAIKV